MPSPLKWFSKMFMFKKGSYCLLLLFFITSGCKNESRTPENLAKMEIGKKVFTELSNPSCATCHTLADAGAGGRIGPDLDELKPAYDRVIRSVTNGVGVMPGQKETLTTEQIQAVAFYISEVTKEYTQNNLYK